MNHDFVCCAVADQQYALRGAEVRLISRAEQMRLEPGTDERIGTVEVVGQTVPVFALATRLGLPLSVARGARYIAFTGAFGELVGWLVDRIARPAVSQETMTAPLPPTLGAVATTWFEALLKVGDQSMLLIAPRQLKAFACPPLPPNMGGEFSAGVRAAAQPEPTVVIFSTPALPRCDALRYALSGRQVVAIVPPPQAVVVPGSAAHVKGVFWWRNAVVPIVDFRDEAESTSSSLERRHIIAQCGVGLSGSLVAFPIDADIAMHRPGTGDRRLTDVARPAFAHGMFDVKGETVALVSLDALLSPAC